MFQHRREKKELLLLSLFLLFTVFFTVWFLTESGGLLLFPQWKEVDHHLYYQPVARSLLPLFPLLVLGLDGAVVLLTLWGLRRRAYLASFAVCLGTLLLFSITLQAFFSGYAKHLLTLLAGAAAFLAAFWISRTRPTQRKLFKVIPLSQITAVLIVALSVSCPLLGTQVNGSRAWIYLGPVSLQPGQLLMPLLAFYAASRFPCRDQKQVLPFFLLSILSPETAGQVAILWTEAYETYYDLSLYHPSITAAKTGTAQTGNGRVNKLLAGYSADLDVAFFLSLENWDSSMPTPQEVSRLLLDQLAGAEP